MCPRALEQLQWNKHDSTANIVGSHVDSQSFVPYHCQAILQSGLVPLNVSWYKDLYLAFRVG